MQITTEGIVCAVLAHGEHGAIARLLTGEHGLVAGYVRGGRSRKSRPVLQPGNLVQASLRARVEEQLPAMTLELLRSRALVAFDPLAAAALEHLTALTAATLSEGDPHPAVHQALEGLIEVIEAGGDPRVWMAGLVRYELLLLRELGFGLDLSSCAATGATADLAYVSPKSSRAVSRGAGLPYADRLLPLPAFLRGQGGLASWDAIADGLRTTGWFLERDVLVGGRRADVAEARRRLAETVARRAAMHAKEPVTA